MSGLSVGDLILFAVLGIFGANHLVLRLPGWQGRAWAFWLLQGLNMGVVCFLILRGIPILLGPVAIFNYILALLLVMHTVQNNNRWGNRRVGEETNLEEKKARLREALKKGED